MAKKQRVKAKSERMRRRIIRRRISLILGVLLVVGTLVAELLFSSLVEQPTWLGSPAYYGLVLLGLLVGFALLFIWNETSGKTDMDELEERMEQLSRAQTQAINRLAREIRKERKLWNAKFKQ